MSGTHNGGILAVTVAQPVASAIALGGVTTLNQTWSTDHRGWMAIHAATVEWDHPAAVLPHITAVFDAAGVLISDAVQVPVGAVVAVVDLVDVHNPVQQDGGVCCQPAGDRRPFHWTLARAHRCDPAIPARGRRKLWTPSPAIVTALGVQVPDLAGRP